MLFQEDLHPQIPPHATAQGMQMHISFMLQKLTLFQWPLCCFGYSELKTNTG